MAKLFFLGTEYLISQHGDEDGHQWRDDVEEAVGKVFDGGDFQHQGLGHAAGVPRYEHGGDCGRVFGRAAEQSALKALLFVQFLIDVAGEHDAQILVACGHVGKQAGSHGG